MGRGNKKRHSGGRTRENNPAPPRGVPYIKTACILFAGVALALAVSYFFRGGGGADFLPRNKSAAFRNVLLITLDTTRADRLGCYGYRAGQTPALDALSSRGFTFDAVCAPAPLTLPSHATIMTGLYPPAHGVRNNGTYKLSAEHLTLAEIFRAAGWRTCAFVSAFVLDERFGLAQGFEKYGNNFWEETEEVDVMEIRSRRAEVTARRALKWMDENFREGDKFFAWLHFFDPHQPCIPPSPWRERFASSPYDGEIAYMDHVIGGLLRDMEKRGMLDDTLVAVTADHGESLGEHGEETHGFFVYDSTVRVPLILWHPSFRRPVRLPDVVSTADIAPTVLELAGLPAMPETQGRSLAPLLRGEALPPVPVMLETLYPQEAQGWAPLFALREGRWKYILAPKPELYDMESDPGEARNLYESRAPEAMRMAAALDAFLQRGPGRYAAASGQRGMTEDEKAKLMSLGYVFGGGAGPCSERGCDPKDMVALYRKLDGIKSRIAHNRFEGLEETLLALLKQYPDNADALCHLGRIYEENGRSAQARDMYEQALALQPGHPAALVGLGYNYLRAERCGQALPLYRQALTVTRDPAETTTVYLQLAICHEKLGSLTKAAEVLREASALNPYASRIYNNLGALYMKMNRLDEGREALEKALKLNPHDPMALQNMNLLRARLGEPAMG